MSKRKRTIAIAVSGVLAAAIAIGFQLGSSGAASGSQQPRSVLANQTIDAKTDPVAAGKALDFCAVISNCNFVKSAPIRIDYDQNRILGDALYNCGKAEAEDEVTVSDERSESTSVEESVSAKAKLGFLGLAKASVEAEVNSKQLEEVATKLSQTNAVSVAPSTIGYTLSRVPTAYLDGTSQINTGGGTTTVTNLELTYPGFGNQAINKVDWTSAHRNMTPQDIQSHCAGLPPIYPPSGFGASRPRGTNILVAGTGRGGGRPRKVVTGLAQPIPVGTNLTLARGRVIYATGKVGKRSSVLRARRRVLPGAYTMVLSGRHNTTMLAVKVR